MSSIDNLRNSIHDPNEFCRVVAGYIDAGAMEVVPQTAPVVIPAQIALVGVDGTGSNAAPLTETETRILALESKVNALLAAIKASGVLV